MKDSFLLLAFGPFGGWEHNSTVDVTAAAAKRLEAEGICVDRKVLDTSLRAVKKLLYELAEQTPAAVLACGLAGDSSQVRLERRARNYADFRIPDVEGAQPRGEQLVAGARDWLYSSSADEELLSLVRSTGASAELSDSAGTYICNALYFHLLHELSAAEVPMLFVHLPPLPGRRPAGQTEYDEAAQASSGLPLEQQVSAVVAAAGALVRGAAS